MAVSPSVGPSHTSASFGGTRILRSARVQFEIDPLWPKTHRHGQPVSECEGSYHVLGFNLVSLPSEVGPKTAVLESGQSMGCARAAESDRGPGAYHALISDLVYNTSTSECGTWSHAVRSSLGE